MKIELTKEESRRIHLDWWNHCRSCRFWEGKDTDKHIRWEPGPCTNPNSPLYQQETWTEGHCRQWDSFDIETAFEILKEE